MDGYTQYAWNQGYNENGMVYPPQHEGVGYDNWRNFDCNYQMQQVPSYYQDWRNREVSSDFQGLGYNDGRSFEYDYQMQQAPSHYQEWQSNEDWSYAYSNDEFKPPNNEGNANLDDILATSLKNVEASNARFEKFEGYMDQQMNQFKSMEYQLEPLAVPVENLQNEEEGRVTIEDALARMEKRMDAHDARMEKNDAQFDELIKIAGEFATRSKSIELILGQLATSIMNIHQQEHKEDCEEDQDENVEFNRGNEEEEKGEGLSEEKSKENNSMVKGDEERCPLMDTSNKEKETQEDELKSEMSISKPLNSSICVFLDVDAPIEFILPLDNFDQKKEVVKILGILGKREREWEAMIDENESQAKKLSNQNLCKTNVDDGSILHERLMKLEAQRMRYNGNEDRYPWPFR